MVTYLGSLVQLCCGEGGTLQTNITGLCGECLQYFRFTGFAPTLGMVYTSQTLGCSAKNCLRWALGCMNFPGLSHSGSGSRVLHKGADSVGPVLCPSQVRSAQVTMCLVSTVTPSWAVHLIASPIPDTWFSGCTMAHLLRCAVCLFWGDDLWL